MAAGRAPHHHSQALRPRAPLTQGQGFHQMAHLNASILGPQDAESSSPNKVQVQLLLPKFKSSKFSSSPLKAMGEPQPQESQECKWPGTLTPGPAWIQRADLRALTLYFPGRGHRAQGSWKSQAQVIGLGKWALGEQPLAWLLPVVQGRLLGHWPRHTCSLLSSYLLTAS